MMSVEEFRIVGSLLNFLDTLWVLSIVTDEQELKWSKTLSMASGYVLGKTKQQVDNKVLVSK